MKLRKLWVPLAALLLVVGIAKSTQVVYNGDLINSTALPYTANFDLNVNNPPTGGQAIAVLSAQANYSAGAPTGGNFNDGVAATGSITVSSLTGLTTTYATDQITIPTSFLATSASDNLTVLSTTTLTGAVVTLKVNGATYALVQGTDWFITNATGTAASLASALGISNSIIVTRASTVVYTTATIAGVTGNNFSLTSTSTNIVVASANFTGGTPSPLANSYVTLNGYALRNGFAWQTVDTASGTAASLATALNSELIVATNTNNVVYATATTAGSAANAFTLTASTPAITIANATFTGGTDNASVCVNGSCVVQGTNWTVGASTIATANSLISALRANSSINSVVIASSSSAVISLVSKAVGVATDYPLTSSASSSITVSNPTMTGGAPSSVNLVSDTIAIPNNTLTLGLPALFATSAGVAPTPLVTGTTYYVIPTSASQGTFQLSTTSTGAVAGLAINFTVQTSTGGGSFSLTPLSFSTGTAGFLWQASNDDIHFTNLNVSSVTFSGSGSSYWDFGTYNYKWLRLKFTGPSAGGLNLEVIINGKQ